MKKIFFLAGLLISLSGFAQPNMVSLKNAVLSIPGTEVPAGLITEPGVYWTISTLSSVGYIRTTSGSNYNTYKSAGGMIVKLKFLKDNRFELVLYVQANTDGTDTESWTEINGTVAFSKNEKGQQLFTTNAERGVYKIIKNGAITIKAIGENELKAQHSNTYLWERASFAKSPGNDYLLTLNTDEHPGVDISQPKTIDPLWISKFHIPGSK